MRISILCSFFFISNLVAQPSMPTALIAASGNTQVALTWTLNSEGDLTSYKVYSRTSSAYDLSGNGNHGTISGSTYNSESAVEIIL